MSDSDNPALKTDVTVTPPKVTGVKRSFLRRWVLRLSLALTLIGPAIFIIAGFGYKLKLWGLSTALGTLTRDLGPKVLISAILVAAIALILAIFIKPRKGIVVGLVGLLVPLAGLTHLSKVRAMSSELPFIHDVTTDTQNVPLFTDAITSERALVEGVNPITYTGKTARSKNEKGEDVQTLVSVLQSQGYPDIRPVIFKEPTNVVFGKAEAVAKHMKWDIKNVDINAGIIEATDTTFWYGFEDDIVIRIRESEGGGTIVDMRSISRIGGTDLGKNASRIREFMKALQDA